MSRINWNVPEGRFFDTGLDRGVLFPKGVAPIGPIIATNQATNASFETTGATNVILETNLVTNPSLEVDTTGWATFTETAIERSTSQAYVGSACLEITSFGSGDILVTPMLDPRPLVTPGITYTASVYIRAADTASTAHLEIFWYDSSDEAFAFNTSPVVATTTNGWTRVSISAQAPAGSHTALLAVYPAQDTEVGEVHYVDAAMFTATPVVVPYFDGSTAAADDFTYAWSGSAHASSSYRRSNLVGGIYQGGAATAIQSSTWSSSGSKSMRVYSLYHTPGSAYVEMDDFAPTWGKTYTIKFKLRVREQLEWSPKIEAFTTGITPTDYGKQVDLPLTNGVVTPGVYDMEMTWTWPAFAAGAVKYLRVYNNNSYGTSIWIDDLIVIEGQGVDANGAPVAYFDGDTGDTGAHQYFFGTEPTTFNKSYKRENQTLAVPWFGLQSVDEEGGESAAAYYIDGRPFLFLPKPKEFKATLKAITYPDAFSEIMGIHEITDGMYLDSQPGDSFDLSYRTLVGNGTEGIDHGYKIHLVYNCSVAPQALTYESLSNSINPTSFSWEIQAVPVTVEGFRPTAHIIIDTRHMDQKKIDAVEALIYGSKDEVAHMPSPQAIFDLLSFGDTIIVTDNGDGTFDVTGSYENVYMVGDGIFRVDNVDGTDNNDGTFTISTTEA